MRVKIGKIPFDPIGFRQAAETIVSRAKNALGGIVVTPNVAHVLQAEHDKRYLDIVNTAVLSLADGMPVLWAAKALGTPLPEKISGSDLIYAVCQEAARQGAAVFFLGGLEGEAEQAAANLKQRYPGLSVVGTHFPPFGFDKDPEQSRIIVDKVLSSGAQIVFIGVGCPKQEYWAQTHQDQLPGLVLMGVGMSIAFCAGTCKRAPRWMQVTGLEWIFRLCQEPRRLALRYAKCFLFPWLVLKNNVLIKPREDN